MHNQFFAVGANSFFEMVLLLTLKPTQVNEIGNDLNFTVNVEMFVGILSQIF